MDFSNTYLLLTVSIQTWDKHMLFLEICDKFTCLPEAILIVTPIVLIN